METQAELFGDSVEITAGYRMWWSYVPHFINTPGYVYAYAYGLLLALSVYSRYLHQGDPFVPRYIELLSAGGSRSPEHLAEIVGIDLTDPGFWDSGLALVEEQLSEAEELAARLAAVTPPPPRYTTGVLARYAALVSSASEGAVLDCPV